jgi:hypothetical protein
MGPPPSRSLAFNAAAGDLNGEGHADLIAVALADAGRANRDRASNADARNRRRDPDSDSYTDGLSVAVAVDVTDTHRRAADLITPRATRTPNLNGGPFRLARISRLAQFW